MSAADRVRVLLVDDHPVVRDGLAGQLAGQHDMVVVAEAGGGEEALAVLRSRPVDVVVTDLRMPGLGGAALIQAIRQRHPSVQVVVLTTYDTRDDVVPALAAGARGYLLKDTARAAIADAIRAASQGRSTLAPSVLAEASRAANEPPGVLSPRELDVLRLVAAGRTNAQIGRDLHIGAATVKTHVQHICGKLGAPDRAAAVAAGYRRKLL